MSIQYILIGDGKRLAVIPEAEYQALVEAAEEREDIEAVLAFDAALARGEEELIPAEFVNRIIDGENKVRVWREYRGMTMKDLANAAKIAGPYLSQIETGTRDGTVETYKKIAAALRVDIDDLV